MPIDLDTTSFANAIAQTEEALLLCDEARVAKNGRLELHLRAGAIQAFEFTYELAVKTIRRYLEMSEPNPAAVEEMSFNELIRRANELGLLGAELKEWIEFRKSRGTTSHTYDAAKAQIIYETIPEFLHEVKFLSRQLERRIGKAG